MGGPGGSGLPGYFWVNLSHLITVVIMIVPIAFLVPAMFVFFPPVVPLAPTPLSRSVQFTSLVICLSAVAPMVLNSFVEIMLCMLDALLAPVGVFRVKAWHFWEK